MDPKSNSQKKIKKLRDVLLGRTKKQKRIDKPSYIGKKMIGLFLFFGLYSFIFVYLLNFSESESVFLTILNYMCLSNPYLFGIALTFTFVDLSLLFSNEKLLAWFFGKKTAIKQILIVILLMLGNFAIIYYLKNSSHQNTEFI